MVLLTSSLIGEAFDFATTPSGAAAIGVGAVSLYLLYTFYLVVSDPLRKIPGPFWARYTRLWEIYHVRQGNFHYLNVELHKKYGPIVRIAPNRYSLSDPDSVRTIYSAGSDFAKSDFYLPFGPPMMHAKDIFSETSKAQHASKRKACSQMYAMSTLISYEPFVNKVNGEFVARLRDFAKNKKSFDLFTWMQFYAFDVIGEITIGESFGLIEAGHDKDGLLDAIDFGNVRYGAIVGLMPEIHSWYLWLVNTFTSLPSHWKVTQRVITREITKHMQGEGPSDRQDFLSKCIESQKNGKMDRAQTNNVVGSNIGAGSDTTGISLSAVIHFLLENPRCMREVRKEIDETFKDRDLADIVNFQEGQKLVYLQAVIKEALRCHAAVGTILSRVVPPGGANLAGQFFPGGTVVGINPWVLHNDERVWGADVAEFKPERWLGEEAAALEKYSLAFGAGARTCIGKNISLLEMSKLLPQMFRQFDFSVAPGSKWESYSGWFVKTKLEVVITPREA